jgi:hypothetical protein
MPPSIIQLGGIVLLSTMEAEVSGSVIKLRCGWKLEMPGVQRSTATSTLLGFRGRTSRTSSEVVREPLPLAFQLLTKILRAKGLPSGEYHDVLTRAPLLCL